MLSGSKQNMLFSLIVQLNASVRQKTTVSFLFQIIHVVELLAIFLVLTNPKDQLVLKMLQSFELLLGLTTFTGLLIVQIVVALKFKFHLQLYNQIKLFRFSIYPLLALILASEITNPYNLPSLMPLLVLPLLLSAAYMNCWLNFHQFSYHKVVFSSTEYSKYLVVTDTVMVLALPAQKSIWIYLISLVWLCMSIRIHFKMKNHVKRNLNDKTFGFIAALKNYLLICLITREIVFENYSYQTIILLTSPTILILFLYELLVNKSSTFNTQIFNAKASLSEFYRFIYLISSELHELKTNMNTNFQTSLLMLFIALHNETCTNSRCILLQSSVAVYLAQTRDELMACNESSNRKILLQKVIKKIETLFQLYEQRYSMEVGLKIIKMQFFTVHILNKIKIKHSIAVIDQNQLDIKDRLIVFYCNEKANELQSVEILEDSDANDEFDLFRKKFKQYLILLREFWSILLEEKVDVTSLVRISAKLFPLKRQIETAWIKNLQNQTFATWNIIKTIILRDMTKACILEDYSKIIAYRLKNKQQLSYMNFESQAGVVVISLTESSLGNISGVNMLATNIFNYYNRGEMLSLRVNDIMPDVFSVVHDNILKTYLKNRYKKINQDERSVLGKNKNGYIFPIYLQLRKLSWNTNDQLIFISNVKAVKLRAAPIYCIVDNEGDIHDVSSTFAWLFYKSNTNQAPKAQNIQRLIPSFFDVIEAAEANKQSKFHFDQRCSVKKNNSLFQVEFTATQLIIKVDKVGYLLEGKAVDSIDTVQEKKKVGELFIQNAQYKNRFNPRTLCYEIAGKAQIASDMKIDDFTIPFMRTVDIQKIFQCDEGLQLRAVKAYGKDIRTFRLVNNRLQLAVEEESFQSQDNDESWRQLTVIKKIQKMKEDMDLQKNKNVTAIFRVTILTMGLCIVAFSVLNLIKLLAFQSASIAHKSDEVSQWKVRSLLPEILIRSYFPVILQDESKLTQLRIQFLSAINKTKIHEGKKESMIKLMNQARSKQSISFQQNVFEVRQHNDSVQAQYVSLLIFQYILIGLLFIFGLGLTYIFYYFQHTIHDIYSIFLSVTDEKLRNILSASQRLIDNITYSTNRMIQKVQAQDNRKKDQEYQEQDQLIIKKFKKNSEFHNIQIAYSTILPIFVVLLFGTGCTIFIHLRVNAFRTNYAIWEKGMSIFPEASLKASQQLFKYLNMSGNFDQTTNFQLTQQEYESQIFGSSLISSELVHILKGDPCHQSQYFTNLPADLREICENSSAETDNSLSNNLNLVAVSLSQTANKTQSDWTYLIKIQFDLLKPLLEYTMAQIDQVVSNDLDELVKIGAIMQIFMICIIAITMIYLIWYPIKTMNQRIMFTKDLMSIIPSENQKKPKETLATLTTEAVEFKEYYD